MSLGDQVFGLLHERAAVVKCRQDLAFFAEWAFEHLPERLPVPAFHVAAFRRLQYEKPKRLLNLWPRHHAKTTCFGIVYPLWRLGIDPNLRFLIVTKTASLADSIVLELRTHIEINERVRQVFPGLIPTREEKGPDGGSAGLQLPWSAERLFVKRSRIDKSPSVSGIGLHGSITGRRADVIIFDDLIDEADVGTEGARAKVETWVKKVVLPVLSPDGQVIWNATRWHPRDIYGTYLLENPLYKDNISILKAINVDEKGQERALWPEMWPLEKLREKREEIGSLLFECQYLNNPTPLEGILFKEEWLHYYSPLVPEFQRRLPDLVYVMGVDPAISESPTADYTAITTLGVDPETRECYVLEIWRGRIDFPTQVKTIQSKYEYMKSRGTPVTKIGVESTTYQKALARTTFLAGLPVSEIRPSDSKTHRMLGLSPSIENGRIRFPDPAVRRESWFESFKMEYLAFPNGAHDDQLDSLDLAFQVADVSKVVPAFAFGPPDWG